MELRYNGKQDEATILGRAKTYAPIRIEKKQSTFIVGDNFDVLSSLLNSGFENKIDLIYIDPPFNTNQTFTLNDNRASTVSRGNGQHIAYNDKMTLPEYIEFMRERLLLMRELLSEQGSIYMHIDMKMGHYLKVIMDEIFGIKNFKNDITRIKSNPKNFKRNAYGNQKDIVLFYVKNYKNNIFNDVRVQLNDADILRMFNKIDQKGRRYNTVPVHAPGETSNGATGSEWRGMKPPAGRHWRCDPKELDELDKQGRIEWSKNGVPRIINYAKNHKGKKVQDIWNYLDPAYPVYPTQKNQKMLEMIIAQSSNPDSIVLDCFAGSGSTLLAAETLNRRWIGIDESVIAAKIVTKQLQKVSKFQIIKYQNKSKRIIKQKRLL